MRRETYDEDDNLESSMSVAFIEQANFQQWKRPKWGYYPSALEVKAAPETSPVGLLPDHTSRALDNLKPS